MHVFLLSSESLTVVLDFDVKVLAYPAKEHVARLSDALHDLLAIPENSRGADIDAIITSTAGLVKEVVSGQDMVENFIRFVDNKTKENYERVCLPFSAPIHRDGCSFNKLGVGRIDTTMLIPDFLLTRSELLLPDPVGWSSTFSVGPAYTPIHHDHWFSGQIIAHQFGHKVSRDPFIPLFQKLTTYIQGMAHLYRRRRELGDIFPGHDHSAGPRYGAFHRELEEPPRRPPR